MGCCCSEEFEVNRDKIDTAVRPGTTVTIASFVEGEPELHFTVESVTLVEDTRVLHTVDQYGRRADFESDGTGKYVNRGTGMSFTPA
jgi:hypothetical protein